MKKSIAIASIGTLIEYYDYVIFSLFLPFFAPVFFQANDAYKSLVIGFYALLIASVARPLGGLVFGFIGDKYGRKTSLTISLYGIAVATLAIGLLPGYKSIGIAAAILLLIIRSFQMLSFGGEYSGAGIYVVELAKGHYSSFIGSILSAMTLLGSVIASIMGLILVWLNPQAPNWRLAFISGGIIGLLAIYFRRDMAESVEKSELDNSPSLLYIIKNYPKQLFIGSLVGGFATLPFTTITTFVNPLLKTLGIISNTSFMTIQLSLSIIAVITLLYAGSLSDKYKSFNIMKYSSISLVILAIPLCIMLSSQYLWLIVAAQIILVIINELLLGPSNAFLKILFPANCRYRGVAFSYCLGMSVVGGLTPVIENLLYQTFNSLAYISIWLMLISIITWYALSLATNLRK